MRHSALKLDFPNGFEPKYIRAALREYLYGIEFRVDNTAVIYVMEDNDKVNIFFSILGKDSNSQYYEFTVTRKEITKDLLRDVIKCLMYSLTELTGELQKSIMNLTKEM